MKLRPDFRSDFSSYLKLEIFNTDGECTSDFVHHLQLSAKLVLLLSRKYILLLAANHFLWFGYTGYGLKQQQQKK